MTTKTFNVYAVAIQHDNTTGRYYPAWYKEAPFPGDMDTTVVRYKSKGHHTTGFDSLAEAQESAARLAGHLDFPVTVPAEGFPVREMEEAGADVMLVDSRFA